MTLERIFGLSIIFRFLLLMSFLAVTKKDILVGILAVDEDSVRAEDSAEHCHHRSFQTILQQKKFSLSILSLNMRVWLA